MDESSASSANKLERYLRFDERYYLADDILVKTDRMSMAYALEVRPPFLDHRIVQFAATLPANLKVRGRRQKVLLKELMRASCRFPSCVGRRWDSTSQRTNGCAVRYGRC